VSVDQLRAPVATSNRSRTRNPRSSLLQVRLRYRSKYCVVLSATPEPFWAALTASQVVVIDWTASVHGNSV